MELLAPAGNAAALRAAVQSGADAVYIGGTQFGARQSADNFSPQQMREWVDYCHLYGVDVHVTVNTLVKEKEIPALIEYVRELNDIGVDALIVQDLGAARIIKETIPDMKLHASTQMTVTSLDGVRYLKDMGFSRVVLARELTRDEIKRICDSTDIEIEVFVHGAICMCYSGQCLMSSILGGRSGNRGRCAQPCRLPYELVQGHKTVASGHLLSPKDMALINDLAELDKIGVTSLKIEGRLKRAEYVSAVVGVYRKYVDTLKKASSEDMRELYDAFSRDGFTDGYFKNELGSQMMSIKNPSGSDLNSFTEAAKKRAAENANFRKIPVDITGTLKYNSPLEIELADGEKHKVNVAGTLKSETAVNKPLDDERLIQQLTKLGATPFECRKISVSVDEGITLPVKEINALRRDAAGKLISARAYRKKGITRGYSIAKVMREKPSNIELAAEVTTKEQLDAAIAHGIKKLYVPNKLMGTLKQTEGLIAKASEILTDEEIHSDAVLVSSPAAAYKYSGKKLYGDFRLNVFNSQTARLFEGMRSVTLSPELNLREMAQLLENTTVAAEVIAYGHLPLMIMKNCPVKACGKCQHGNMIYRLRDRKKEEFPLECAEGCRMILLNSKPLYMADKTEDLKRLKINSIRLIFTVENFSQCGKIIEEYRRGLNGESLSAPAENSYTRGHFYRGVL